MANIFIFCPDNNAPSGGVRKLYLYVDQLNELGFEASIVHERDGFKCTWFDHETRISYLSGLKIRSTDILAFPEISSYLVHEVGAGIRKVIINQNVHYTFSGFGPDQSRDPYRDKDVVSVLVHSEHDYACLKYLYPSLNVHKMLYGVDAELFKFNSDKRRQIAYMPRKYSQGAEILFKVLEYRKLLDGFDIKKIDNLPIKECAKIMRDSLLFLSFSSYEGFGLPPVEAMSSGCIVIGFHGNGGREYFDPRFSYPIEYGDVFNFALTIENVLKLYKEDPGGLTCKARMASEYVSRNYSLDKELAATEAFWNSIIE
jgi:Glycosyl transferases group 1